MIRAILTDIEGTTSSISFVKDVLFPYARAHLAEFVHANADDAAVRKALDEVSAIADQPLETDRAIDQLLAWIDEDRKITPLKALQGMIWEAGYRHGDFRGHMYPDAVEYLRRWRAAGLELFVYSSGSVQAQKLLFAHTDFGDLSGLFRDHFDTRIGAKTDPASYRAIQSRIGIPAEQLLFLSDIVAELDAARSAGLRTVQLVRDAQTTTAEHPVAHDFSEIDVEGY